MIIYRVANLINNKVYIGQTIKSLERRIVQHNSSAKNDSNYFFHKAIRKYGKDNFKWQVICICPDIKSLNEQEEYYILYYNSINPQNGYNLKNGGDNYRLPDSIKKKIGEAQLGKKNHNYGKCHSEDTRKKISMTTIRKGIRPPSNKGKKHSEEAKRKISIALSGKNNPNYGKVGILSPRFGTKHTAETKEKIKQSLKKFRTEKKK